MNGAIKVPSGPGLGVKLDREKLGQYAELYKRLGGYPYDQDPLPARLGADDPEQPLGRPPRSASRRTSSTDAITALPRSTDLHRISPASLRRRSCSRSHRARIAANDVKLTAEQLTPGTTVDLTGQWLFKPGYAKCRRDAGEVDATADGYVPVPVPQILNRIHWWLDDSEDFKK